MSQKAVEMPGLGLVFFFCFVLFVCLFLGFLFSIYNVKIQREEKNYSTISKIRVGGTFLGLVVFLVQ